jgi:hypothetical protein
VKNLIAAQIALEVLAFVAVFVGQVQLHRDFCVKYVVTNRTLEDRHNVDI